jgi:hypothetical protein
MTGLVENLKKNGLKRPRVFAYSYGEQDERIHEAIQEAGLQAAFTIDADLVRPGQDSYQVPRIEILSGDVDGNSHAGIFQDLT